MRAFLSTLTLCLAVSLPACEAAARLTGTGDRTGWSADEAAAFLVEAAATLASYSDPDDAFATFTLAGGAGAPGSIQPSADSLPAPLCQNPRDPVFYEREHRGLTYVWDPDRDSYVYSTETGAAPCSIRITRYTLADGRPIVPLERLGYISVTDLYSPGPASGIHFVVIGDSGADLDTLTLYSSHRSYEFYTRASTEHWSLSGFFDRAGDRFDFAFSQTTSSSTSPGATYHNVTGSSVFTGGGVRLTTERTVTSYTVTVERGDRSVEFRMERPTSTGAFAGEIRTIGAWGYAGVVGRISGSPEAPTFRDSLDATLPAAVAEDLATFWIALLGQLGLDRWPHV